MAPLFASLRSDRKRSSRTLRPRIEPVRPVGQVTMWGMERLSVLGAAERADGATRESGTTALRYESARQPDQAQELHVCQRRTHGTIGDTFDTLAVLFA